MSTFATPADTALPTLDIALDATHMAAVFSHAWRMHGIEIQHCTVERLKYRPGHNASLVYRLSAFQDGNPVELLAGGRLSNPVDARRRCARYRATRACSAQPAPFVDDTLGFFGWSLPDDPKLPTLPSLLDPSVHRVALSLPHLPQLRQLRYVAESRACVRIDLAEEPVAFAKLDRHDGLARQAHALLTGLERALADHPAIRLPRPLALQESLGLQWQTALRGAPLTHTRALHDPLLARQLGSQLAALHRAPVTPPRAAPDLAASDGQRSQELVHAYPTLAPRITRLVAALHARAPVLAPSACLHGDLHPRNVLLDAGRPGLIDLDAAHRGPAVVEIGHWGAQLHAHALVIGTPVTAVTEVMSAFLEGYQSTQGERIGPRDVAWAMARALLADRAHRVLTRLHPGGEPLVSGLLEVAERLLHPAVSVAPSGACSCA